MEGGGEGMKRGMQGLERRNGMVAIIRGLQDAGLAVTVMNDLGSQRSTIYAPRSALLSTPQYPLTQAEGTNTRLPVTTNISSQVNEDGYTSSYRFTHCIQRPPSPPVRLSEFQLKKPDVRRDQGNSVVNIERNSIGGMPSMGFHTAGISTPYRTSFSYHDRGIPTLDLKTSEAFADSLRKYPFGERSPSAELISKILSFTLHKKDTSTTKCPQNLPKERPVREKRRYKDQDIQTYTRARPKIERSSEEMKTKSFKRMRIRSPGSESRGKRYKASQWNETYTYDYLKSQPSRYYSKTAEVRYLSNVSKCIKDTIRQIVDDGTPEMCTELQNRYLQHRKRCQSRSAHKQNGACTSRADASQVNVTPFEPADAFVATCPHKALLCYCKKGHFPKRDSKEEFGRRVTKKIGNWLLDIPTYAKTSAEDKQKRIDIVEDLANKLADLKDEEDIEEKARKEVEKCLNKLPMWLPSSKEERDDFKSLLANNLMNKLKRVFEGADKFDDEINKWINDVRFKSRDSFGEIIDKDKITDTFADRIKALVVNRPENDDDYHETLKYEVINMLNDLPIETTGDKSKEIERLAYKLVNNIKSIPASEINQKEEIDTFAKEILKWIDIIGLKRKDSQGNIIDKDKIKANVIKRLKSIALDRPSGEEDYQELLENEIVDILEESPFKMEGNKSRAIEKLATKLANELKKIPKSEIKQKSDMFDEKLLELLKDIRFRKRDSECQLINTGSFIDIFAERLKPLIIDRPNNDDDFHEVLKNEIRDILEELPIEVERNKEKYIDRVAEKLTNELKNISAHEMKLKTDNEKFDDKISQWFKDIKFYNKDNQAQKVDKAKILNTLRERLKSIAVRRPENDDEYHEALKNEVLEIFEDLPLKFEGEKDKFFDKLASKIANTLKNIPTSEIQSKSDTFKKKCSQRKKVPIAEKPKNDVELKEVLKSKKTNSVRELPKETITDKEKAIDNLLDTLLRTLNAIPERNITKKSKDKDPYNVEIMPWLENIPELSFSNQLEKNKMTEGLAKRLKEFKSKNNDDNEGFVGEIMKWLANEVEKKGTQLDSRTLASLSNQLSGNIFESVAQQKESAKDVSKDRMSPKTIAKSDEKYKEDYTKEIQAWLDNKPQFYGNKEEKDTMINNLAKNLQDLRSEGILDDDEIKKQVTDWLNIESRKKGIKMDARTKNDMVNQLTEKIGKAQLSRKSSEETEYKLSVRISDKIRNIPEVTDSDDKNVMVDRKTKGINAIGKEFGGNISDDTIQREVNSSNGDIIENSGVDPKQKDKLPRDIISKGKSILKPSDETKQTINNGMADIIDSNSFDLSPQAKKNVIDRVFSFLGKTLGDDEQDQKEIRLNVQKIIDQETDLSNEDAEHLTDLLISSAKEVSDKESLLKSESLRSVLKFDSPENVRAFISDKVKRAIGTLNIDNLKDIEENVTDLLVHQVLNKENSNVTSANIMELLQSVNVSSEDTKDNNRRFGLQAPVFSSTRRETLSSLPTEFTFNEKEMFQTSAIKEITDFIDEVIGSEMDANTKQNMEIEAQKLAEKLFDTISDPNQSITDKESTINYEIDRFLKQFDIPENGPNLVNRLKSIAVTSTPRTSLQDSFYPRRRSFSLDSIYAPDEVKKKIEKNDLCDLEADIERWILDLPVQIEKSKVAIIARNLAGDIADRHKYLQSYPEVKLTDEEELEFLKYQIFRNMGKSIDAENLAIMLNQTSALLADIKKVLTPVLSKPPLIDKEDELKKKLLSEISMWLNEIHAEFIEKYNDYNKRQEKIKELAEEIINIVKNMEYVKEKIESEVSNWLKRFIRDIQRPRVQSLVESLKNRLRSIGILQLVSQELSESSQFQQDTSQFLEENLSTIIMDWLKRSPLHLRRNSKEKRMQENMIEDLSKELKKVIQIPESDTDLETEILKAVKKHIERLTMEPELKSDKAFIDKTAAELVNYLKTMQMFENISQRQSISSDEYLVSTVNDWIKSLSVTAKCLETKTVVDLKKNFITRLKEALKDSKRSDDKDIKEIIRQCLQKLLVANKKANDMKFIEEKVDQLFKNILTIPLPVPPGRPTINRHLMESAEQDWREKSPADISSVLEDTNATNALHEKTRESLKKTPIRSDNLVPEKLHDLAENLVTTIKNKSVEIQEEIKELFSDLTQISEMEANIEFNKGNLMSEAKKVNQKTQDEHVGQTYKQHLRDTISKTLPFDADLSAEGPEPFELLVDNLADAYVNLNFITDGDEQKTSYKTKIADEITKYCNDYLKRHPDAPLDTTKLNQDLYNALKNVPTPKEEIIRSEAQQVRMKNEIKDWMKELPLIPDSGPETFQKNKMASVLAKKLVDLEKEKEMNPDINYEGKAQKEIAKFIKKLPIDPGYKAEIDDMVKHLMQKIQSSEQSRKISTSSTRQSIDMIPEQFGESSTQPSSEDLPCDCRCKPKQRLVSDKYIYIDKPVIPTSILSSEDRAHLDRIRLRNQRKIHKKCSCKKNASVSPPPIDAASQTELTPTLPRVCPRISLTPCLSPCLPSPPCISAGSGSEQEVSPQIIIKEYLWDSGTSKLIGPVYRLPCIEVDTSNFSVPSLQKPLQKSVSIQPSSSSFRERPDLCKAPCSDNIGTSRSLRPCTKEAVSPCPSPHQFSTPTPCPERKPCPPLPRPCRISFGTSPCQSRHQIPSRFPSGAEKTPCPSLRPCNNFDTQKTPYPTRLCNMGKSPCSSPHEMSPKPCISLPKPVISSQPSPCNRPTTISEIPYCSTPRRPIPRDPNVSFRQPNFKSDSRTCSPDRENRGPRRILKPRIINIGEEDSQHTSGRDVVEFISEYKDSYRPKIYRIPSRDLTQRDDGMRCCRCKHRIQNVCQRHRSSHCPSTENLRHCSKCCGLPCPHPMRMFFR